MSGLQSEADAEHEVVGIVQGAEAISDVQICEVCQSDFQIVDRIEPFHVFPAFQNIVSDSQIYSKISGIQFASDRNSCSNLFP